MNNMTNWLLAVLIVLLLGFGTWQIYAYQNPNNNGTSSTANANNGNNQNNQANTNNANTQQAEPTGKLVTEVSANDWTKGPDNAQIKLVAYGDFQCPACRQLGPIFESMVDKFPGKVSFTFRHFPLSFHPFAAPAAQITEAAGAQGKFWEMHDFIMKDSAMTVDSAYAYAATIGLDVDKMKQDVDGKVNDAKIQGMMKDGESSGVQGTPSLYLNGELLSWADTTAIEQTITKKLK